jgi:Mg-chelatase subunit ChlD
VLILVLLAARPFLERPAGLARDIVLVVDTRPAWAPRTSAEPARGAKSAAIEALKELPTGGKVSVIAAERTARIVANETSDLGPRAPGDQRPRADQHAGDLGDALELASKLARRSGDAQVLVATDGRCEHADHRGRRACVGPAGRARPQEPGDRRARRAAPTHRP